MTWLLGAVALVMIICSALLAAGEAAVFALGESRLRTLTEEGFRGAEALARLRATPSRLRASVLFLTGVFNFSALALLMLAGVSTYGLLGGVLTAVIGVPVILVIGQLFPRAAAERRPLKLALSAAPTLGVVDRVVGVALRPLGRIFKDDDDENGSTHEERVVHDIAELGKREGVVGEDEHILVERAFRLDESTAWDVMTPRVDIFSWKDSLTLETVVDEMQSVPFSRVPVYGEGIDDVTGILHIREALETHVAGRVATRLSELSREPLFVPGSLSLTRLLRQFQMRRIHMGIVADEFGGTDGLVTLEDVLEELVGEIEDETDITEEPLIRVSRSEIIATGSVDVREINHAFNVALPRLEHRSLNGLILEELGYVPKANERIERYGVTIEILEASETQVLKARLGKPPSAGGGEPS
ncbi:MAG: hemolysin family protein [Gemmatimonadota bacterium]|nr:MAG: hemolysin family protein [Gemmatimonadota bacterium]